MYILYDSQWGWVYPTLTYISETLVYPAVLRHYLR